MIKPTPPRPSPLTVDIVLAMALSAAGAWILIRMPPSAPAAETGRVMFERAFDVGWLLVACGAIIVGANFLAVTFRGANPTPIAKQILLLLVPLLAAALLVLNRIETTKTAMIDGHRYFWLDDDVMISMRYALNFARGEGLVWNGGRPPVEGYSNFLWVMILSLPHLIGLPLRLTSGAVLAINGLILAGVFFFTLRVGRRMGLSPACRWLTLLLLAFNRWFIHWTAAGSEVLLMALALLIVADRMLGARRNRPLGIAGGLALGCIALIRADGLTLALGFIPALILLGRSRRLRWSAPAIAVLIVLAHLIFRRVYYGHWLPNTYWLKVRDIPLREVMGVHYIQFFFLFWGSVAALHLVSMKLARHPVARWIALTPWVAVGYATLIGGDELGEMRFLAPVLPLFALGAVAAGARLFVASPGSSRAARGSVPGAYGLLVIVLALPGYMSFCLPNAFKELGRWRGNLEEKNVRLGLMLKKNTDPEALIAHFWAGAAPYFSERPAHDMLGKNDPVIAHAAGHRDQWQPGHTKYDPEYSMSLRPDVVVTAHPAAILDPSIRDADPDREAYPSLLAIYDNPTFEKDYASGLVRTPLSENFHGVFVRSGSRVTRAPDQWDP